MYMDHFPRILLSLGNGRAITLFSIACGEASLHISQPLACGVGGIEFHAFQLTSGSIKEIHRICSVLLYKLLICCT